MARPTAGPESAGEDISAAHLADLRVRLAEAEDTLEAIRSGAVDALVIKGPDGDRVYTLASADRSFRELAERMTDGAATVSDDGTILWANGRLAALVGWPTERMLGSPMTMLLPDRTDGSLAALLESGRTSERSAEGEILRADGSPLPIRLSVSPVSVDGIASAARAIVISDLTERRQAEAVLRRSAIELELLVAERTAQLESSRRELRAAEDNLRMLLEVVTAQLPVGLIVAEPAGRIVYRNKEAERIFPGFDLEDGVSTSDAPARDADSDGAPARNAGADALKQALAGQHVAETEVAVVRDDGKRLYVLVRAEPVHDEAGNLVAAVCVSVDITGRRQSEALRDAFIDVTAHELKTPLTTIYGAVQTLANHPDRLPAPARLELLGDAVAETEHLVRLVDDMLVLSRVERGVRFLVDEPLVLSHIAGDVIDAESRRAGTIKASLRVEPGSSRVVLGERNYVEQVISNLLRNAAKYGAPPVEVVVEPNADGVAVRVLDRGPGFTSQPDALFDLYFREQRAATRASGGGIGLFVCRELVKMMGGRVWAANRSGGGAEFGFVLPPYPDSTE